MGMCRMPRTRSPFTQRVKLLPHLLRQTKLRRNLNRMRGKRGHSKANTRRTSGSAKHGSTGRRVKSDASAGRTDARNAVRGREIGDKRKHRASSDRLQRPSGRTGRASQRGQRIGGDMGILKKKPEVQKEEPKTEAPVQETVGCLAVTNDKVCGKPLAPGQSGVCAEHIRSN